MKRVFLTYYACLMKFNIKFRKNAHHIVKVNMLNISEAFCIRMLELEIFIILMENANLKLSISFQSRCMWEQCISLHYLLTALGTFSLTH